MSWETWSNWSESFDGIRLQRGEDHQPLTYIDMEITLKTFYIIERKDVGNAYKSALLYAGYQQVHVPERADFMLLDFQEKRYGVALRRFNFKRPIFIYPHSALSWYYWDGIRPEMPVACNFVFTPQIKKAMKSYGYQSRVEYCGFPRCEVQAWAPTRNRTLLYAPYHSLGAVNQDKLIRPGDLKVNQETFKTVLSIAPLFEQVVVRFGLSHKGCGIPIDTTAPNLRYETSDLLTTHALRSIEMADVVISAGSLAYMAVARGKPTIFFGGVGEPPREMSPDGVFTAVQHYDKYHWIDYPVRLADMSRQEIVEFSKTEVPEVAIWKTRNIGGSFDRDKFISVIREYR